jgi:hypothetical protein
MNQIARAPSTGMVCAMCRRLRLSSSSGREAQRHESVRRRPRLHRVTVFFLRVILWRSKNRHNVLIPTRALSASLALIPASEMSGVSAESPRLTCECASIRFERRSPL